jgi:hypothetical protein
MPDDDESSHVGQISRDDIASQPYRIPIHSHAGGTGFAPIGGWPVIAGWLRRLGRG